MVALGFFLFFLFLLISYGKKAKWSVGFLLLAFYTFSALLTFIESFVGSVNYDHLEIKATLYYTACVLLSLWPFLILGKNDCRNFEFSDGLLKALSYLLIFFGLIELTTSIVDLYAKWDTIVNNLVTIRTDFYDTMNDAVEGRNVFYKMSRVTHHMQFMAPFCCIYFITKNKNNIAWWLFLASLSFPIKNMTIGEREASLVFLSNYAFCILFFKSALRNEVKRKLFSGIAIALIPFVVFLVAMTFARASFKDETAGTNLLRYGGDQPFFFSYLFNTPSIHEQRLEGRLSFQYLFPLKEQIQDQLNNHIQASNYLNQFGGLPGTFYLDFGYYAIIVITMVSLLYYFIINASRKRLGRYPFYLLYLFYFSYQIVFMNLFYFDFGRLFSVFLPVIFLIFSFFVKRPSIKYYKIV